MEPVTESQSAQSRERPWPGKNLNRGKSEIFSFDYNCNYADCTCNSRVTHNIAGSLSESSTTGEAQAGWRARDVAPATTRTHRQALRARMIPHFLVKGVHVAITVSIVCFVDVVLQASSFHRFFRLSSLYHPERGFNISMANPIVVIC